MIGFIKVIRKLAKLRDVVPPVDPDDDGKVLARNSSTGKYEHVPMSGGGGGAQLDEENTWAATQLFNVSGLALPSQGAALTNGEFTDDLSSWTDVTGGWSWDAGAAVHTPGADGELTQDVTMYSLTLVALEVTISGMTAGSVDVYNNYVMERYITSNGVYSDLVYVHDDQTSDTIHIYVSSDFDGRVESVRVTPLPYAFAVARLSAFGSDPESRGAIYGGPNGLFIGAKHSGEIDADTAKYVIVFNAVNVIFPNVSITDAGKPSGTIWRDGDGYMRIV